MAEDRLRIIRNGNYLTIDSTDKAIWRIVLPALRYEHKTLLFGRERQIAKKSMSVQSVDLYGLDAKQRPYTMLGMWTDLKQALKAARVPYYIDDKTKYPRPNAFEFDWDRIKEYGFEFRPGQREALEVLVKHCNGRISCPPGWGKSFILVCAAIGFKNARITITTRCAPVMTQRIYPEMLSIFPEVGLIGGGHKRPGRRVTCVTSQSLHHADLTSDILLIDECHQSGADNISDKLVLFPHAHIFGLSASNDMRIDGADKVIESICGPIRFVRTYTEALGDKAVVPTIIKWRSVEGEDPAANRTSRVQQDRYGYWRNEFRNEAIADDARSYPDDVQVLVTVARTEHALVLQKYLPEFTLVYRAGTREEQQLRRWSEDGIIDDTFKPITPQEQQQRTEAFTKGELKKVIATGVWNQGVDFKQLAVLVRADGSATPADDIQIPGRTARVFDGKEVAIVHDYLDQFSKRTAGRADTRSRSYKKFGYEQKFPVGYKALRGSYV